MEKVTISLSQEQTKALFLTMGNSMGYSLRLLAELVGEWEHISISTDDELDRIDCQDLPLDLSWGDIAYEAEGLAQVARTLEKLADGLRPRIKLDLSEEDIREISWHIDHEGWVVLIDHLQHKLGLNDEQIKLLSR